MTTDTHPTDMNAYSSISELKQEPAWLAQSRAEAYALAAQLGLPKLEKTRIDRWNMGGTGVYRPAARVPAVSGLPEPAAALAGGNESGSLLVHYNSGVVYVRISPELERQGVIFTSLEQAAADHPELVQAYFMKALRTEENRLTALHAALWNGGAFLYVPKNVTVREPVQAIFCSDDPESTFAPHIVIVAEAHSSLTYVDNYVSVAAERPLLHNGAIEVFAKAGASVRVATVHNLAGNVTDVMYRRAQADSDARVEWIAGELSFGNAMADTQTILKGNGSASRMKVIGVGTEDQKLNYTTRAVHIGKASSSDMITRAVMRDEATAIINGITKIEHGAKKADGQQTERVLMLSPKARGDANPILLIDEDDVKAGHAASVGKVNPEQVYYLMSRGTSRQEAERLIIYGFLRPVIEEIPLESLREQLGSLVERKLGR